VDAADAAVDAAGAAADAESADAVAAGAASDAEDAEDADGVAAVAAAAAWDGVYLGVDAGPGAEPSQRALRNLFVYGPDNAIRPLCILAGDAGR
jgi:DNA/RNA-binding domain of Phe-tRNA-synthetase-like protein